MAFLQRVVLGDGVGVDRADGVEFFAQAAGEVFDARPVGRRAGLLDEALVKVEKRRRVGREEFQVDPVALRGVLVQVFLPQPQLRLADLLAARGGRARR